MRLKAAAIDGVFFAVGLVLLAVPFLIAGGGVPVSRQALYLCGAAVGVLLVFYRLYWCILGADSPGLRLAGLRLLTFDGYRPSWQTRVLRFGVACLGTSALGLGLLWALVDDEGLAYHDHLSKTFLTKDDPHPGTFHRR